MIRVTTTVILAVAVLAGFWYLSPSAIRVLVLVALALALWEWARLFFKRVRDQNFFILWGIATGIAILWSRDPTLSTLILIFSLFACFAWVLFFQAAIEPRMHTLALLSLGIMYLPFSLHFWAKLRDLPQGVGWLLMALIPSALTDTFGFLVGKTLGHRKLAPLISPNKTVEGFAGALVGAILGAWLTHLWVFPEMKARHWITIGFCLGLLSPLGDLLESLFKRSVGVKDSSHLIPGHGGILDRLDALVFSAPFVYWYVRTFVR